MTTDNPWDEIGDDENKGVGRRSKSGGLNKNKKDSSNKESFFGSFFSPFSFFGDSGNSKAGGRVPTEKFGFFSGRSNFQFFLSGVILMFFLWLASGFYIIRQEESGIVLRFGKYVRDVDSGLHYHLPYPIEEVAKGAIKRVRILKIGGDFGGAGNPSSSSAGFNGVQDKELGEGWALTGDENIVNLELNVQWKIIDLKKFIFGVRDKEQTIYDATQSVVREVVSKMKLADILTSGRGVIEEESKKLLQQMLDDYNMGVEVLVVQMLRIDPPSQVVDSFRDVQTARVDKESEINKAYKYRNDIIPKVKGEAGKIIEDANAYSIAVVNKANGEASRFNQIYEQYKNAPFVTRKRMYLDAMSNILDKNKITIVDDNVKNVFLNSSGEQVDKKIMAVENEDGGN